MKRILFFFLFMGFLIGAADAQRRPDQFTKKSTAEGTDEIYSQAGGTGPYRITFDTARLYFIPDILQTQLGYALDSTGTNVVDSLRGKFVLDSAGTWWYVDQDKTAVQITTTDAGDPDQTVSSNKVSNNVTVTLSGSGSNTTFSVADADSSATNETITALSYNGIELGITEAGAKTTVSLPADTVYALTYIADRTGIASPRKGDIAVNAAGDSLAVYNGAAWATFAGGGKISATALSNDTLRITEAGLNVDLRLDKYTYTAETKSALTSLSLAAGAVVQTRGYATAGDGGGARYEVISDTTGLTAEFTLGTLVELANGNFARIDITEGINPMWIGATDGPATSDDTDEFQAIFDYCAATSQQNLILIPRGRFEISSTLTYDGTQHTQGLRIQGWGQSRSGFQGASIDWTGAANDTMIYVNNVVPLYIQDIDLRGKDLASIGIYIDALSATIKIERCNFGGFTNTAGNYSCIIDSYLGGTQVSEVYITDCTFSGSGTAPDGTDFGIRGGFANNKNWTVRQCSFNQIDSIGIYFISAQTMNIESCSFAGNKTDVAMTGGGTINLIGNESEGCEQFFYGGGNSSAGKQVTMIGNFFSQGNYGTAVVEGDGKLTMITNQFTNNSGHATQVKWGDGSNLSDAIFAVANLFDNVDLSNPSNANVDTVIFRTSNSRAYANDFTGPGQDIRRFFSLYNLNNESEDTEQFNAIHSDKILDFASQTVVRITSDSLIIRGEKQNAVVTIDSTQVALNAYGTGTNTGTATYLLGVDASGNVTEEALTTGNDGNGIYDGSGSITNPVITASQASGSNVITMDATGLALSNPTDTVYAGIVINDNTTAGAPAGIEINSFTGEAGILAMFQGSSGRYKQGLNLRAPDANMYIYAERDLHIAARDSLFIDSLSTTTAPELLGITATNKIVKVNATTGTGTDDQTLSFTTPNLSIEDGNSVDLTALDTLNALSMGGNIALNGNYLSGDGGNEGLTVDASGNVTITGGIYSNQALITFDIDTTNQDINIYSADKDSRFVFSTYNSALDAAAYFSMFGEETDAGGIPASSGQVTFSGAFMTFNTGKTPGSDFGTLALRIDATQKVGVGEASPTAKLHIDGATGYDLLRLEDSYTPTSSADTNGNTGDIAWDVNYIYVKTGSGWKRAALSTF